MLIIFDAAIDMHSVTVVVPGTGMFAAQMGNREGNR